MRARVWIVALLLRTAPAASMLGAQELPLYARPLIIEVRSSDTTRGITFGIAHEGAFLASVGVLRPSPGHVVLDRGRGSATTPALLEFADSAGTVTLTAETGGPWLVLTVRAANQGGAQKLAAGWELVISRDAEGRIRLAATR